MNSKKTYLIKSYIHINIIGNGLYIYIYIYFITLSNPQPSIYNPTLYQMFQKHFKTILYFEKSDSVVIDPFDYGNSRMQLSMSDCYETLS